MMGDLYLNARWSHYDGWPTQMQDGLTVMGDLPKWKKGKSGLIFMGDLPRGRMTSL
jgi:hypothetical protein